MESGEYTFISQPLSDSLKNGPNFFDDKLDTAESKFEYSIC